MTKSDSEILIPLYLKYGTDCLKYLRWEFAFILYDKDNQIIFSARDRMWIKPLHYNFNSSSWTLLLASKAKALFALWVQKKLDKFAVYHCLTTQYRPKDQSMFQDIYQVQPGSYLIRKKSNIHIHQYWDFKFSHTSDIHYTLEDIEQKIKESVKLRLSMDSGVRTAFHISGWIDSSLIASLAQQYSDNPIACFTAWFHNGVYDETEIAKRLAKDIGAKFHYLRVTEDDFITHFADAIYQSEACVINNHIVAKYMLNKYISKEWYKVLLTWEGADEIFLGYAHLQQDMLWKHNSSQFKKIHKVAAWSQLINGQQLATDFFSKKLWFTPTWIQAKASFGYKLHKLLDDEFASKYSPDNVYHNMLNWFSDISNNHPLHISTYLRSKFTLANYILHTLADWTEMAHSIEWRIPFLDHHLIELVANIPPAHNIKNNFWKHTLRLIAEKHLPDYIARRHKQPFMAPPLLHSWNKKIKERIYDQVHSHSFRNLEFLDQNKVIDLLDNIQSMNQKEHNIYDPILCMILSLYTLNQQFIST